MRRLIGPGMWAAVLLWLVCLTGSAMAAEEMQVSIPVTVFGHSCTVELYDDAGKRVQLLTLQSGEEGAFVVQCTGLQRFTYTALVADKNTANVTYDRRNYRITIDLIYDENDQLRAMVFIENLTSSESKLPRLEFVNVQKYHFHFTKRWSGGRENSIDWEMYNADGSRRHKLFTKQVVSGDEWRYEATFDASVEDCYVIEIPPEGYLVHYENVGKYSGVTDRCYSGGTIINYKTPQTSDASPLLFVHGAVVAVIFCMALLALRKRLKADT